MDDRLKAIAKAAEDAAKQAEQTRQAEIKAIGNIEQLRLPRIAF